MGQAEKINKVKVGKISVSLWRNERTIRGDAAGYRPERTQQSLRVCVTHSKYNWKIDDWKHHSIWMDADELRDLANAIDEVGEQ